MKSGSHISYTKTLEEQTLVYLSITPPNLSMMLVWNNLADPHLSAFARFSQSLALKLILSCVCMGMTKRTPKKTCEAFRMDFGNLSFIRSLCLRGEFTC